MITMEYQALLEPGETDVIVVSFPDVPEAITQGDDREDALEQAQDALGLALLTYIELGRDLPAPGKPKKGLVPVCVEPATAAKIAVLDAFRKAGITKSELAERLGKDHKEVRRILDPMHLTKIGPLNEALRALGHRMVISFGKAA